MLYYIYEVYSTFIYTPLAISFTLELGECLPTCYTPPLGGTINLYPDEGTQCYALSMAKSLVAVLEHEANTRYSY